ncbi:MAG: metalloprotease PmbA [Legionellales bacterium]|nr:metalloprotease PmbA [Legionellales bacterium]
MTYNDFDPQQTQQELTTVVETILAEAKSKGADNAEVVTSIDAGYSVNVRLGEVDTVEYHRDKGVGITVYYGQRKGSASTVDTTPQALAQAVEKACYIAKHTAEDPFAGLADKSQMAFDYPELSLYHPWSLSTEDAIEFAKQCEALGLAQDERVTNSDGVDVSTNQGVHVYGNSHGFIGVEPITRHSFSCCLVAKDGDNMQRDYDYTVARDPDELLSLEQVAKTAADKAVNKLNGRQVKTGEFPVIFHHRIASGLLRHFFAAIKGSSLYREASFLLGQLGKPVFPDHIQIDERPHLLKGLGSSPYDSDGVMTRAKHFIKDGMLASYLLGTYGARKLGMASTGNAGGAYNVFINTSDKDLSALIKDMGTGFLVTDVMGQGINIVTGDYSRGANGFWVENGEIQFPVEEVTIAGNLKDMYRNIVTVANDIDKRSTIVTGSILIDSMMLAGE